MKRGNGSWKNWVIGILLVIILVLLFYKPGVLLSPSNRQMCIDSCTDDFSVARQACYPEDGAITLAACGNFATKQEQDDCRVAYFAPITDCVERTSADEATCYASCTDDRLDSLDSLDSPIDFCPDGFTPLEWGCPPEEPVVPDESSPGIISEAPF
ncbi:MAG: hypothetical protein AABW80_02405 [Nanoarchaeota archaeon]